MELTRDNYYSVEADREYMSCSQYQEFLACEAAAMAKLEGRYVPSPSEALVVGNYFHTAMESEEAHKVFCEENFADIYKTKTDKKTGEVLITGKYAPYEAADRMIEVCYRDPLIKSLIDMPGENEVIMTGILFGIPWKIRLDKYMSDKRLILDWKTTADINKVSYNPLTGERESFVEALGYIMRAAVYTEIEKQFTHSDTDPDFVIVAVSKQDPPDKAALLLNHRQRYDWEIEQIEKRIGNIIRIKSGSRAPRRCGMCEYCRGTKVLNKIIPYYLLNPRFREEREEEWDNAWKCSDAIDLEDAQEERGVQKLPALRTADSVDL